jgi:hypothetical protein
MGVLEDEKTDQGIFTTAITDEIEDGQSSYYT